MIEQLAAAFDTGENIAELLSEEDLKEIGRSVVEGYKIDLQSRSEWETRNEQALKLALQITEKKTYPFDSASNVKFPLITVAALQYSARAYPALIQGTEIVKCRVIGSDPTGEKHKRAWRVSKHMSYQVLEEDEGWEEDMDKLLICKPIIGCAFKKTYFDAVKGHNVSEHVFAKDLIISYYARSLEDAPRLTQVLTYHPNEVEENVRLGLFLDNDSELVVKEKKELSDTRQGLTEPAEDKDKPYTILEQHCLLDLDDDGYKEPYVVHVDLGSGNVKRIFPRFSSGDILMTDRVIKINPVHYFTKYTFVPSPDGGIYDLGFGALLGPLNETINTSINLLIDAGHMSTLQGGFIGKGARIKGGNYRFKPNEWKVVQSSGGALRENIVPLPSKEPSQTLFQLLGLLIEYSERVSSVTDLMTGQTPGQNTPATTAMAALEQGMKVFTGIYKRTHRSLRQEFRKLYRLNYFYLDPKSYFEVLDDGSSAEILQNDYRGDPKDIKPTADPNIASETQRLAKATALREAARSSPGYNLPVVERRYLEALQVDGLDEIYPVDEQGTPLIQAPPPPEEIRKSEEVRIKSIEATGKISLIEAQIQELETRSLLNIAKAEGEEAGSQLEFYQLKLQEMKEFRETLKQIEARNENNTGAV